MDRRFLIFFSIIRLLICHGSISLDSVILADIDPNFFLSKPFAKHPSYDRFYVTYYSEVTNLVDYSAKIGLYDANGSLISVQEVSGRSFWNIITDMKFGIDGNLYLTVDSRGSIWAQTGLSVSIKKLDPDLKIIWSHDFFDTVNNYETDQFTFLDSGNLKLALWEYSDNYDTSFSTLIELDINNLSANASDAINDIIFTRAFNLGGDEILYAGIYWANSQNGDETAWAKYQISTDTRIWSNYIYVAPNYASGYLMANDDFGLVSSVGDGDTPAGGPIIRFNLTTGLIDWTFNPFPTEVFNALFIACDDLTKEIYIAGFTTISYTGGFLIKLSANSDLIASTNLTYISESIILDPAQQKGFLLYVENGFSIGSFQLTNVSSSLALVATSTATTFIAPRSFMAPKSTSSIFKVNYMTSNLPVSSSIGASSEQVELPLSITNGVNYASSFTSMIVSSDNQNLQNTILQPTLISILVIAVILCIALFSLIYMIRNPPMKYQSVN